MKRTNYKERGITLVALVITIIVLLILAGVSISTALGQNGLFQRAKYAGEKYKESEKQEQSALEDIEKEMDKIYIDYNQYVGASVEYKPTNGNCIIEKSTSGIDEDNAQEFSTEEGLGWKIWDYDGNTLRLISDKPTDKTLKIKGAIGYNNGIYAMNEICRKCYGAGGTGISATNLKLSDLWKVTTTDYTSYCNDNGIIDKGTEGKTRYGSVKTYSNQKFPIMWENYDSKWEYKYDSDGKVIETDKEGKRWEQENNYINQNGIGSETGEKEFKQSYWYHEYSKEKANEEEWKNPKYYDLLFKDNDGNAFNKDYYLAHRFLIFYDSHCDFGIERVNETINDKFSVGVRI